KTWRRHSESDAGWRARRDDITRLESHELAHVAHQGADVENHRASIAGLHSLAIDVELDIQILRVGDFVGCDQPRTDWPESVASFSLVPSPAPVHLVVALAYVIDQAVPGHIFQRVVRRDVAGLLAHDNPELYLPVHLLGAARNH